MNAREAYQVLLNGGRIKRESWSSAYIFMTKDGTLAWDDDQAVTDPLYGEYIDVSPPKSRTYYLSTDDLGRVVLGKEHLECFCGLHNKKIKVTITEEKK